MIHEMTFDFATVERMDGPDLRPDAQSLGALKHRSPLMLSFTHTRYTKSRFGKKAQYGKSRSYRVSIELLSQVVHQAVASPLSPDLLVAERIKQACMVCNSVALNRYSNVLGEDVVLNTCQLAYGWWKSSQRKRKTLPFPITPSMVSQAAAWAV